MTAKRTLTRREMLGRTAGALGAATFPYVITSSALARPGRPGANDRIITGHIGVGGMGGHHLNGLRENAAAVCDVDANHLKHAVEVTGGRATPYKDFRRLLERKDIDAIVIAAPDHWHGLMTVYACQAGFDVYCEKPASKTIAEGRAMVTAARRYGRVVQIGSQGRSTEAAYYSARYIQNGQLGQVRRVACWHYPNPVGGTKPDCDPPPTLDWDLWLGPARWVPYNPDRCHFNFRWLLDFGGGQIRDRGAHVFSVVLWCLDPEIAGPVRVEATGNAPREGLWDCPVEMDIRYQFKDPDWELIWSQPGDKAADAGFGAVYYGDKGKLIVTGGDGGCGTEEKARLYEPPAGGKEPFRSPGHWTNFADCIRTRRRPIMDIEAGHRVATLCIIGNIAYRLGRPLQWDAVSERFVGDEEANRWLGNPGRGPWHV